jgi:DNA gyrase subunit B
MFEETDYQSSQIQVLSGVEAVRKRPEMYFGSTNSSAMAMFVYELVANVLDLYLAGTATFVHVAIDNDNNITVVDDGLGLPFDLPSDLDEMSLATNFLSYLHFTGTVDTHAPHLHIKHGYGIGLAVLNAASCRLKIQSWRDGMLWEQRFDRGIALDIPRIIDRGIARGTRIEITPDPEIFNGVKLNSDAIRWSLFETAHLVKGIEIGFGQERFYAPEGLVQLLPFIDMDKCYSSAHLRPFYTTVKTEEVSIDVVACGSTLFTVNDSSYPNKSTKIRAWVNGIVSIEGGSHINGFLNALKDVKWHPELVMINVIMLHPEFAGPTRTKLHLPIIAKLVRSTLIEPLNHYLSLVR